MREYEIVQRKIDNYGTSDIMYNTLVASATFASLYSIEFVGVFGPVLGAIVVLITLYAESKNHLYEKKLFTRAQQLEKAISKGGVIKRFPSIAYDVMGDNKVKFPEVINNCKVKWRDFPLYYATLSILILQFIFQIIQFLIETFGKVLLIVFIELLIKVIES